jgi:DNA anti-recombination protein RmuC
VATNDAVARGDKAERDYVDGRIDVLTERLNGIDRATELLSATVNRVPTDVQKEITHLDSLVTERFESVATQFRERDTRSERESRDNKVAVDAAFAAQKEAAAKQDESNAKAIDKSEKGTAETIAANQNLNKATTDAQQKQLDEITRRLTIIETTRQAGQEVRAQTFDSVRMMLGLIATVGVLFGILGAMHVFG